MGQITKKKRKKKYFLGVTNWRLFFCDLIIIHVNFCQYFLQVSAWFML